MRNLFLCFLLLFSFAANAQTADTDCEYENCEEVESDDPLPAPISDWLFVLAALGIGVAAYVIKSKNE